MAGVSLRSRRSVVPARTVLVRDRGIWTGRLSAWERIDGVWHGHVVWEEDLRRRRGVVPVHRLRAFDRRWVEVAVLGDWYPGQLVGVRRRPGYDWEGCVQTWERSGDPGPAQWYAAGEIRQAERPPPGISEAF